MLQDGTLYERISLHLYAPPVVEAFGKEKTPENLMKALLALMAPNNYRVVREGLSEGLNWKGGNDKWACHMLGPGLHGLVDLEVTMPGDVWGKDIMFYPGYFSMVAFKSASGITARSADSNPPFIAQDFGFGRISAGSIHSPRDLIKLCTTFRSFSDPEACLQMQTSQGGLQPGFQSLLSGVLLNMISTILNKVVGGTQKIEIVDNPVSEKTWLKRRHSFWAATPALANVLRKGDSKTSFSVEEPALLDTWRAWIAEENLTHEAD